MTQAYDKVIRPSGVRATQLPLLVALSLAPGLPLTVLGQKLHMDRTTLTRNLRPLESAGLVRVMAAEEDRRRRVAELTPQGARALRRALPLWQRAQQQMLARFGAARWAQLQPALRDLARAGDAD
jgi:DNA-binding MarR family transcriptional regulator